MDKRIVERLKALEDSHGRLTPDVVIQDARSKDSPLHGEFEWDTKKAAQKHWQDQARALIRAVKVVVSTDTTVVKSVAYVRDPNRPKDEQGYISVANLRRDPEGAHAALVEEFSRASSALKRARGLAVALQLEDQVGELHDRLQLLTHEVETRASN